jgi:hypothetical protein
LYALGTREFKEGVSLCPRRHWPTNYLRIGLNPNNFVSIKQRLKKKDNKKWNIVTLLLGF